MGSKAEALARQFEAKAREATGVIERLSEADWRRTTADETWTVAVVAHHVASGHEGIASMIQAVASGQAVPALTLDMLHDGNARHAREHANATKAETVALHEKGAAAAAAVVRGLSDEQLAKSATVLQGRPALTVEQMITGILMNHIDSHVGSIRKTVGVRA